jgi:hypothetical protein
LTRIPDPHSCRHCQTFIIGEDHHKSNDNAQERLFQPLKNTLTDILNAASEDCAFCAWLLDDDEYIHRSLIMDAVYASLRLRQQESRDRREVFDAMIELAVGWMIIRHLDLQYGNNRS